MLLNSDHEVESSIPMLASLTLDHEVPDLNLVGGRIQLMTVRRFIAHGEPFIISLP